MSCSANLVGAFFRRNRTDSGPAAVVDEDGVSRVEETIAALGIKPVDETRPVNLSVENEVDWNTGARNTCGSVINRSFASTLRLLVLEIRDSITCRSRGAEKVILRSPGRHCEWKGKSKGESKGSDGGCRAGRF